MGRSFRQRRQVLQRPSASVADAPSVTYGASLPLRAASETATDAAGRPMLVSRMWVDTDAVVSVLKTVTLLDLKSPVRGLRLQSAPSRDEVSRMRG